MIRIFGRSLSGTTSVMFEHSRAAATVLSDTEVVAVVPPGAAAGRLCLLVGELIVSVPGEFHVQE